jgi:hypothetical protein
MEVRKMKKENKRFTVVEGSYYGNFSDDIAGHWYICDREADIIDKRGMGFRKREANHIAKLMNDGKTRNEAEFIVFGK